MARASSAVEMSRTRSAHAEAPALAGEGARSADSASAVAPPPTGRVEVVPLEGAVHVRWERGPLNIFDTYLLQQLSKSLRTPQVLEARVIVLEGVGNCWSAGFEVKEHLRPQVRPMLAAFREAVGAIRAVRAPTIAQVQGHCLGGGLELLMACDLAVGSSSATFGQPEVHLGVFPPYGVANYAAMFGPRKALELLLLGEKIPAEEAQRVGILNRVVPDGQLAQEVAKWARTLGGFRPSALRLIKQLMAHDTSSALHRAERSYLEELMAEPGAEDGLKQFLSRSKPAPSSASSTSSPSSSQASRS